MMNEMVITTPIVNESVPFGKRIIADAIEAASEGVRLQLSASLQRVTGTWFSPDLQPEAEAVTIAISPVIEALTQAEDSISVHIMTDEDVEREIIRLLGILHLSEDEFCKLWANGTAPDTFEAGLLEMLLRYR
jgi:hypothetical protein